MGFTNGGHKVRRAVCLQECPLRELPLLVTRDTRSNINNCIAKWRLGACDIQELPLLAASS